MGLNDTVTADRVHIAFFGKRNAGKSSLMNAVTSQQISMVSDVAGTTTDPVYKAMELLPLGPVMLIDTAGMDDTGELGGLRVKKTRQVLNKTDIAVLVIDATAGMTEQDRQWIKLFRQKNLPFLTVYNKTDLSGPIPVSQGELAVSSVTGEGIQPLKQAIAALASQEKPTPSLIDGLTAPGDLAILVTPIDAAAPKGRLILPQQQTIRALLDQNAMALVVQQTQLKDALSSLNQPPKIVITDSQVFEEVSKITPHDIPLTSFSILVARQKGNLALAIQGVTMLDQIQNGDRILIAEGCTHHRQCDDIGTVKLPRWIREYTGKTPEFVFTSGTEFPEDLSPYRMAVHCGGCMLNPREMKYRQKTAKDAHLAITNYGIAIAYMKGILQRSLAPFPQLAAYLSGAKEEQP